MYNETVAKYYFNDSTSYLNVIEVVACYDEIDDFHIRKVSFYDLYDSNGVCLNEGNPYYDFPSWNMCRDFRQDIKESA